MHVGPRAAAQRAMFTLFFNTWCCVDRKRGRRGQDGSVNGSVNGSEEHICFPGWELPWESSAGSTAPKSPRGRPETSGDGRSEAPEGSQDVD